VAGTIASVEYSAPVDVNIFPFGNSFAGVQVPLFTPGEPAMPILNGLFGQYPSASGKIVAVGKGKMVMFFATDTRQLFTSFTDRETVYTPSC
jgi:hypothetical protein